jgi:hypothetical protein
VNAVFTVCQHIFLIFFAACKDIVIRIRNTLNYVIACKDMKCHHWLYMKNIRIPRNYRLPADLVEKLDRYAEALGIDRTQLIEQTLDRYLDAEAQRMAEQRRSKLDAEFTPTKRAATSTRPKRRLQGADGLPVNSTVADAVAEGGARAAKQASRMPS